MFNKKKYSSYSERKKKEQIIKIGSIVLGTTICVVGLYQFVIMDYYGKKVRENTINELTNQTGGYINTYILKKDIMQGNEITIDDLEPVTQNESLVPDSAITNISELEDKVARIDLKSKSIPTSDMFSSKDDQITDKVKNQDFNWIRLHTFLELNDYVDIHYKQVDGTDFVVAAKKKVSNISGNTFSSNITDDERVLINNATVRADITGGELYLTIYPEPENQNPAEVTYILDRNIQQEIEKQPTLVEQSAKSLQEKNTRTAKSNFAGGEN